MEPNNPAITTHGQHEHTQTRSERTESLLGTSEGRTSQAHDQPDKCDRARATQPRPFPRACPDKAHVPSLGRQRCTVHANCRAKICPLEVGSAHSYRKTTGPICHFLKDAPVARGTSRHASELNPDAKETFLEIERLETASGASQRTAAEVARELEGKTQRSRYLRISTFATKYGYSEAAVRHNVKTGLWPKGPVCFQTAQGQILIDQIGFERWSDRQARSAGSGNSAGNGATST